VEEVRKIITEVATKNIPEKRVRKVTNGSQKEQPRLLREAGSKTSSKHGRSKKIKLRV
jgi:hypothetical protein